MAQVERAVRHTREQQHAGHPVDGEPERGEQAQKRGATPEQLPGAEAVMTHQHTGGRGRRDVPPGSTAPAPIEIHATRRLVAAGGSGKK